MVRGKSLTFTIRPETSSWRGGHFFRVCWPVLLLIPCCTSRHQPTGTKALTGAAEPLALVGPQSITIQDVLDQIRETSPFLQARYRQSSPLQEKLLDQLIEEELIVAVAKRRGLDKDPRLQRLMRQHLVNMIKEDVLKLVSLRSITDQEIQSYYQAHPQEFSILIPDRLRVSHLLLSSREKAEAVARLVKTTGQTEKRFAALAKKYSIDTATREKGGDLGCFTRPGGQISEAVFRAAKALRQPGDISDLVFSDRGWHIVRLTSRVTPRVTHGLPPLKKVYLQVKLAIFRRKREETYRRFLSELHAATPVQRFPDRMNKIQAHLSSLSK